MQLNIAVIKGDGIGPEIVPPAMDVLTAIGQKYGHTFNFQEVLMGCGAFKQTGTALPQETIDTCKSSDSVLFGSIGDPRYGMEVEKAACASLLDIRSALGLYANIRPAVLFQPLKDACPLRKDSAEKGIDMVIIRELTGGIYFGERGRSTCEQGDTAFDTEKYSVEEVRRIAKVAFDTAMVRNKKITSIDKANVLESSRLWREVVHEVAEEYPEVEVRDMYVDNAAMQLVLNPSQFDVILANNIFGDILSDEAAAITGSIGMLPSASIGSASELQSSRPQVCGLYEPIHGSAPDIAGQDKANPIATILSAAMMLKYSFGLIEESTAIENAVNNVLQKGVRTLDIKDANTTKTVGTKEMGILIIDEICR